MTDDGIAVTDCKDGEERCRLGWRYRTVVLPDGSSDWWEEPLTEADLLDLERLRSSKL
jgi:hypothetical protein